VNDDMTNEVKFTPGPWDCYPASNYVGFAIAPRGTLPTLAAVERPVGGQTNTITAFNFPGETEANARLIASAPQLFIDRAELLAMVQRLLPYAKSHTYSEDGYESGLDATISDAESLLARITKATDVADDDPSKDRPTESVQSAQTGGLS
jgi:hypothetical protein